MSSTYGEILKLSVFGQSHGPAIGMTLDGVPAGLHIDYVELHTFLSRRAPGMNAYSTTRKEVDDPEFLSGIIDGYTCGAPIAAIIRNFNIKSDDYSNLKDCPRPGHCDFPAHIKYKGYQDVAGGGHFSGRLTAPLCIAGGLCKQWLETKGIQIGAHISQIAGICDDNLDWVNPDLNSISKDFPVVNSSARIKMQEIIAQAKKEQDSVGGTIECFVTGLPTGLGGPMFGGIEGKLAQALYGIPAVKGVEFGTGFNSAMLRGSENNDPYTVRDGRIQTTTNNAGGILGGISTGMPIVFRAAIKPTPSIAKEQQSVSISQMEEQLLTVQGRHDPCIVPRAVPVVEAVAAIALFDLCLCEGIF